MRVLAGLAAATVVLATAWFGFGPGAGAPIGACSAEPGTSVALQPEGDVPTVAWADPTRFGGEAELDDEQIVDVERFGDRFVAVQTTANGPEAFTTFRRSGDGDTWQASLLDAGLVGTELRRLRVVGDRIFALGTASTDDVGGSAAAVWFSDDGLRWRAASGPFDEASAASVAGTDEGLLLIGSRADASGPLAWRSRTGEDWTSAPMRLPVDPETATFTDLARTEDGWLAVGFVSRGPDADSAAVRWTSADGESWACHVLPDDRDDLRSHAWELHRGPRGWLVVGDASRGCGIGASCPGFQIVWSSVDGAWTWGESPGAAVDAVGSAPMLSNATYAGTDAGFIAVGGGTWTSEDGWYWTQLAGSSAPPGAAAVAANGVLIVSGGAEWGDDGDADAWLAAGLLDR
jgi:hypothetical protein